MSGLQRAESGASISPDAVRAESRETAARTSVASSRRVAPFWWLVALVGVIGLAIAMRAAVNFSAALPPGVDAAYYPLQSRALMERGALSYNDLPLIFVFGAAAARVLMATMGMGIDEATLLASRLVDSVSQPWAAVAVFGLGLAWARGAGRSGNEGTSAAARRDGDGPTLGALMGVTAAAIVATVSIPMLRMTGDFEKNSLGLVWFAFGAWAVHAALGRGGVMRWGAVVVAVLLAAVTHVAVVGATVLMLGATLLVYVLAGRRVSVMRVVIAMAACAVIGVVLLGIVHLASPKHAAALMAAPLKVFGISTSAAGGLGTMPGGPRLEPLGLAIFVVVYAICVAGLRRLRRDWAELDAAQIAVVAGSAITAMLLCFPLYSGEYFMRLSLMAPVPGAIVLAFVMVRRDVRGCSWWPAPVMAGVSVASVMAGLGVVSMVLPAPPGAGGAEGPRGMMHVIVADEAAAEFRSLREFAGADAATRAKTVVLARHGLQWWAGYFMDVPVRDDKADAAAIAKYERALMLVEKRVRSGPGGPESFDGPQSRGAGEADGAGGASGRRGARGGVGGAGGPGRATVVPADARLIHEGEHFKLFELRHVQGTE